MNNTFKKFLIESLSDILYHYTNLNNAFSIVETDKFKLSPIAFSGIESNMNNNKKYFMSFSRSKGSSFAYGITSTNNVSYCFVLNGRDLKRKYSGSPVSYFNNKNDLNEFEDRLLSNDPIIKNALHYVEEIHCVIKNEKNNSKKILEIDNEIKKHNIKIYYYSNIKDFINQNKNKSINISNFNFNKNEVNNNEDIEKKHAQLISTTNYEDLMDLISLDNYSSFSELNRNQYELMAYSSDPQKRKSVAGRLNAFIDQNKKYLQEEIQILMKIMQTYKSDNISDLLLKFYEKFKNNK